MDSNTDNIYADYEKIVPSEKLHEFLFDYFREIKLMPWAKDDEEEKWRQVLPLTINKYAKYKLPISYLDKLFFKFYVGKNKIISGNGKKNILFRSSKYSDIISDIKKHHHVGLIAHGIGDRVFAAKNFMGYVSINDLDHYVLSYLKEKNIKYLYQLVREVENKLTALKPDYIVLWNDILPVESAIILAARKLGIVTIEIQHGMYTESSWPDTRHSTIDKIFVWGEHFKNLYVESGIRKPEDVYVLGYPYSIAEQQDIPQGKKKYTVCYLGENFEIFDKSLLDIKLEIMNTVSGICKNKGLDFVYRPHPGDDRNLLEEKLPDIRFTPKKEKLKETFEKADIFISFISTSLTEAAMRSKIALQLLKYPLDAPNYEKLGVCNKTFRTFDELESYLIQIAGAPNLDKFKLNFNNGYVETRYNPGQRFLEIIKEIEKNSLNNN